MTSAREYPVSSQKPSLQKMMGTVSTWALAMMNFRSGKHNKKKTILIELINHFGHQKKTHLNRVNEPFWAPKKTILIELMNHFGHQKNTILIELMNHFGHQKKTILIELMNHFGHQKKYHLNRVNEPFWAPKKTILIELINHFGKFWYNLNDIKKVIIDKNCISS